jgi:hypothetical protein
VFIAKKRQVVFLQFTVKAFPGPGKSLVHCTFFFLIEVVEKSRGVLLKVSCLSYKIKGNVGDGNVLFEHWSVTGPFAVALSKNQGIVGKVKGKKKSPLPPGGGT